MKNVSSGSGGDHLVSFKISSFKSSKSFFKSIFFGISDELFFVIIFDQIRASRG